MKQTLLVTSIVIALGIAAYDHLFSSSRPALAQTSATSYSGRYQIIAAPVTWQGGTHTTLNTVVRIDTSTGQAWEWVTATNGGTLYSQWNAISSK
jgi:hypothetical protein